MKETNPSSHPVIQKVNPIREKMKGRIQSSLSGFLRAFIVGLLVLFQFGFIIILPFLFRQYTVYLYVLLEVLSLIIMLSLVNDNRSPSYIIAWICIVLAFPISGHIMYAMWGKASGTSKLEQRILLRLKHGVSYFEHKEGILEEFREEYPTKFRLPCYLSAEGFPLFKNNEVTYFPMGEDAFEDIFLEIKQAKSFIMLNFFIVAEGAIWDHLHELLLERIEHGVKVMFMYDDFGAMFRTHKGFQKQLESEGFEVRIFNPIHKYTDKLYMNYRSHQKIVVIDGNIGYTGGFNVADEYANLIQRFGVWKDTGIKIIGDAVWGLTVTFMQMWEVCSMTNPMDYNPYRPTMQFKKNDVFCQVVSDGPANNPKNPIENMYMQMIQYATEYVYITTPYLVLESNVKQALITAAQSGVDIRIITPYIPDKKNVKHLTNYNYGVLLKEGVRIYEYKPGFIHAKTIINEDMAVVGTINMDYRSFYLHYECGVCISNREAIKPILEDVQDCFNQCIEITYEDWKDRPLKLKLYQMVLNLFSTLM